VFNCIVEVYKHRNAQSGQQNQHLMTKLLTSTHINTHACAVHKEDIYCQCYAICR